MTHQAGGLVDYQQLVVFVDDVEKLVQANGNTPGFRNGLQMGNSQRLPRTEVVWGTTTMSASSSSAG
jgi:hypothetical protein